MDLLIVLTYVALAWAVFKIFRIPVNQWTLATAALGGVFLVSGLILLMNYNHPYTFTAQKSLTRIISLFKRARCFLSSTRFVTRRELTDFRLT